MTAVSIVTDLAKNMCVYNLFIFLKLFLNECMIKYLYSEIICVLGKRGRASEGRQI